MQTSLDRGYLWKVLQEIWNFLAAKTFVIII